MQTNPSKMNANLPFQNERKLTLPLKKMNTIKILNPCLRFKDIREKNNLQLSFLFILLLKTKLLLTRNMYNCFGTTYVIKHKKNEHKMSYTNVTLNFGQWHEENCRRKIFQAYLVIIQNCFKKFSGIFSWALFWFFFSFAIS